MLKEYAFNGVRYRAECFDHYPQHPSWYTFEDEQDLRQQCFGGGFPDGGAFLDCGAAFGAWTLAALAAGAKSAVAWTPQHLQGEDPEIEVFAESLALNGWTHRARLVGSALYDKPGFLNLASGEYADAWREEFDVKPSCHPRRTRGWLPEDGVAGFWRPCAPLDEWMRGATHRVDWVKIDVEGAEVAVLKGARLTLLSRRPKVIIEHHLYMDPGIPEACLAVLKSCGYRLEKLFEKSADLSHGLYVPEGTP